MSYGFLILIIILCIPFFNVSFGRTHVFFLVFRCLLCHFLVFTYMFHYGWLFFSEQVDGNPLHLFLLVVLFMLDLQCNRFIVYDDVQDAFIISSIFSIWKKIPKSQVEMLEYNSHSCRIFFYPKNSANRKLFFIQSVSKCERYDHFENRYGIPICFHPAYGGNISFEVDFSFFFVLFSVMACLLPFVPQLIKFADLSTKLEDCYALEIKSGLVTELSDEDLVIYDVETGNSYRLFAPAPNELRDSLKNSRKIVVFSDFRERREKTDSNIVYYKIWSIQIDDKTVLSYEDIMLRLKTNLVRVSAVMSVFTVCWFMWLSAFNYCICLADEFANIINILFVREYVNPH